MASTTNYAWSTPDNSGLVKNGAQDIRTLGDAIDTAVWNVGYGQAGKNKIINGDFRIAQRGTSITMGASGYSLDRYDYVVAAAVPTATISQQTFTPGTAPVAGYEGSNFARVNVNANNGCTQLEFGQRIEDVRTFAGQTATFSFWAKADAAATFGSTNINQNFGSGGSGSVTTTITMSSTSLGTGWVRYTGTVAVPSISGKTLGANSFLKVFVRIPTSGGVVRNGTYDFWGWQFEAGSVATPFQTASGSIAGELALAQRYYYRNAVTAGGVPFGNGFADSATSIRATVPFPVEMRTNPSALEQNGTAADYGVRRSGTTVACSAVPTFSAASKNMAQVTFTTAAATLTPFEGLIIGSNTGVTTAYLGWSAEL